MSKIKQITDSDNLRRPSKTVRPDSTKTEEIVIEMKKIIDRINNALALAAPQIGINKQIVIINKFCSEDNKIKIPSMTLINPKITNKSRDKSIAEEGCLSVAEPELRGQVSRHNSIKVKYQDQKGSWQELQAEGLLARIIQHEVDHLKGKVFLDRADYSTVYQVESNNNGKKI